jgi:hypothetical protein
VDVLQKHKGYEGTVAYGTILSGCNASCKVSDWNTGTCNMSCDDSNSSVFTQTRTIIVQPTGNLTCPPLTRE